MGDSDAAAEEHEAGSIVRSVVEDHEHDGDTDQTEDTTTFGQGIFLVGACGAIGWLVGYTTIVYWDIDPWLVGPALAVFLGGGAGLVITMLTTSNSSNAEDTP